MQDYNSQFQKQILQHSMGQACKSLSKQQQLEKQHQFLVKNNYASKAIQNKQMVDLILERIANNSDHEQYRKLAQYISKQPRLQFSDPYFQHLQLSQDSQSSGLSKMYDFTRRNLQKVYRVKQTPKHILWQKQVQMSYLTCIFYAICQFPQLKRQLFVTASINPHCAYIINLYCNGRPTCVMVDESIPVSKGSIKYLQVKNPDQIWPFLLEKAWCKQIGSYDQARGLSPEDGFEQITGIPARSHAFYEHSPIQHFKIIKKAKEKGYWIVLTSKIKEEEDSEGLKNRQVFYLQDIKQSKPNFVLRSPYRNWSIQNRRQNQQTIQLQFNDILGHFDFYTIGSIIPNFVTKSYSIQSKKNQQKWFVLKVQKSSLVNIRFIQFYSEYLLTTQKPLYEYSSVFMQLFNDKFDFVPNCGGCPQNLSGIRSANLTSGNSHPHGAREDTGDFVFLDSGDYYLRIFIDWDNLNQVNEGNIVVYSDKTVSLSPFDGQIWQIRTKTMLKSLQQCNSPIKNKNQQLKIRHIEKTNGYVMGIQNLSKQQVNLKVIFQNCKNIQVNHQKLVNDALIIQLGELEERIFQILPQDPKQQFIFSSFDIVRN